MSNQSLAKKRAVAVAPAAYSVHPFYPERAQGSYVWDADGKRYLDWSVGIAVMNIGHSHPKVLSAVKEQIDNVIEELGDADFYKQGILNAIDVTQEEVTAKNMAKLKKRYGDGYTDGKAQARADKN